MVLLSLVDGSALASVHLRMVDGKGRALMARRPGNDKVFQGVLTAERQAFELVMTNLTSDAVLMMDIGGEARHLENEFWDKKDKTFWSGRHRNDGRLNRSNILWPMTPNVCDESNIHYQQTGVSRRLELLTQSSLTAAGVVGHLEDDAGYPFFVYPKYGSRVVDRFERTIWSCPETVVVIGSPQLLVDSTEGYTIQRENPINRKGSVGQSGNQGGVVESIAESLGVSTARLLEVAQVDGDFLAELPPEHAHEVLMLQLTSEKIQLLAEEATELEEKTQPVAQRVSSMPAASSSSSLRAGSSPASGGQLESAVVDAAPAAVVAGERMIRLGGHNLLIEKFDFGRCSCPAVLSFGVHERLQLSDDAVPEEELETLRKELNKKITELCSGRREALLEQICSVYETPECVICLGEKPDAVLYQCGHRCVHLKCVEKSRMRRCPLCRAPIAAVLPEGV